MYLITIAIDLITLITSMTIANNAIYCRVQSKFLALARVRHEQNRGHNS